MPTTGGLTVLLLLLLLAAWMPETQPWKQASDPRVMRLMVGMDASARNLVGGEAGAKALIQRILSSVHDRLDALDVTVQVMDYHFPEDPDLNATPFGHFVPNFQLVQYDFYQMWTGQRFRLSYKMNHVVSCSPASITVLRLVDKFSGDLLPDSDISLLVYVMLAQSLPIAHPLCPCRKGHEPDSEGKCRVMDYDFRDEKIGECVHEHLRKQLEGSKCGRTWDPSETRIPVCRNGIVEVGEGCDCFSRDEACLRCCDMRSCASLCATFGGGSNVTASPTEQEDGMSGGAIAGIVIAVILLLLLVAGGVILLMRRQRRQPAPRAPMRPVTAKPAPIIGFNAPIAVSTVSQSKRSGMSGFPSSRPGAGSRVSGRRSRVK